MADDTTAASLWNDGDVYVAATLATANPADASTPFGPGWTHVGLLDGATGFEESRSVETKKLFAWGSKLVRQTWKNFETTKKFGVLEDNPATRALIWPGSSATELILPRPVPIKIGFETREGGKTKRLITRNYATVEVDGSMKDSEEDLTSVTLVASIFPDANDVFWDRQTVPNIASLALTPLTLALATAGANIKLVTATATYSDASTGNVTASASWSSSVPATATVSAGYVTGVSAGTTNITATFGGVTSTAPCVVTVT